MTAATTAPVTLIEGQAKQVAWAITSHLLAYPDDEVLERLPLLREATSVLPDVHAMRIESFITNLESANIMGRLADIQQEYVDTFDTRRRSALYLTYFAHGDTRRRGMAILDIKEALSAAGVSASEQELPDHLSVILEFAGTVDPDKGEAFLRAYRPGLEMVRLSLEEKNSPWTVVLQAVCATLPALESTDRAAIERLIAAGPDEELVGLPTYGTDAAYRAGPPTTAPRAWDPTGGPTVGGPLTLPTPTIPPRKEPRHG